MVGGPIASQEAIKDLGTNGGGFFNANSSHPFENPTALTDLLEIFLLLVIPFSLPRTLGRMVGDTRQGWAITAVMGGLCGAAAWIATWAEMSGARKRAAGRGWGDGGQGGPLRSGRLGPVRGLHDGDVHRVGQLVPRLVHRRGRGTTLLNMMLGEVAPGGVGAGLYGMLVIAVLAVFLAGLMVGRTPEYLGKKIGRHEVTLVALYVLTMPDTAADRCGADCRRPGAARRVSAQTRARMGCPRSSTPMPRPPTTTGRRSPGSARTPSTRTSPSGWHAVRTLRADRCSSSPWPGGWPLSERCRWARVPCPPTARCSSACSHSSSSSSRG